MRDINLFQLALGLTQPWEVTECKFDPVEKRLDIRIGFSRGSKFSCPSCGVAGCKGYDTVKKTVVGQTCGQHNFNPIISKGFMRSVNGFDPPPLKEAHPLLTALSISRYRSKQRACGSGESLSQ